MKSLAGGELLKTGLSPREGIGYALSLPIDTLVSGMDSLKILEQNLEIVRNEPPLTDEDRAQLLERTSSFAVDGHLERYKVA